MTQEELWQLSAKALKYGVFLGIALKIGMAAYNDRKVNS